MQIALSDDGEHPVRLNLHVQKQIARRRTVGAGFALTGETDHRAIAYTRRNRNFERFLPTDEAGTLAGWTNVITFGTGTMAIGAGLHNVQRDIALNTAMRLLKGQCNFRFRIFTANRETLARASAPAAEETLKEIAESALTARAAKEIAISRLRTTPARRRPELLARLPVRPERVVALAFVAVRQNGVRFVDLLEFFFGGLVAGIDVGMMFAGELAVCRLDFIVGRRLRHAENFVVISELNRHGLEWRFTAERDSALTASATR